MGKEIYVVFWEGKNNGYIDGRAFLTRKEAEQYAMQTLININPKYNRYIINELRIK